LAGSNRYILELKQDLTPLGGYNQRQLAVMALPYKFSDSLGSNDTIGALLKYKDAMYRTKLDGTIISPQEASSKKNELVRVKSMINNSDTHIYRDEIGMDKYTLIDGSSIGLSFASALTEAITQAALGLKHGGSKINYEDEKVVALEDGVVDSIDMYYVTIKGTHTYKYPLTKQTSVNIDLSVGTKVKKGDPVVYTTKRIGIDWDLVRINTLIDVHTVGENKWGQKVNKSMSYSPYDGIVTYDLKNEIIQIGNMKLDMDMNELYFYPDGAEVHAGDRLSTGIIKLQEFEQRSNDLGLTYKVFFDSFTMYCKSVKNSEPVELLFKAIRKDKYSVKATNLHSKNYLERIYNANTKSSFEEAIRSSPTGNVEIKDSVLIPLLFRIPKSSEI
jgi:hypothetical protein